MRSSPSRILVGSAGTAVFISTLNHATPSIPSTVCACDCPTHAPWYRVMHITAYHERSRHLPLRHSRVLQRRRPARVLAATHPSHDTLAMRPHGTSDVAVNFSYLQFQRANLKQLAHFPWDRHTTASNIHTTNIQTQGEKQINEACRGRESSPGVGITTLPCHLS